MALPRFGEGLPGLFRGEGEGCQPARDRSPLADQSPSSSHDAGFRVKSRPHGSSLGNDLLPAVLFTRFLIIQNLVTVFDEVLGGYVVTSTYVALSDATELLLGKGEGSKSITGIRPSRSRAPLSSYLSLCGKDLTQ
jgi:hypothetical protein